MSLNKIGKVFMFLVGLYLISVSVYNIIQTGNQAGWVMNGFVAAIGGGLVYYSWTAIKTVFA